MSKKQTYIIRFKYPNYPWVEYDRTQVSDWRDVQLARCIAEHPDAKVEVLRK